MRVKNKTKAKHAKKIVLIILFLIAVSVLYLIIGCMAPFVVLPDVDSTKVFSDASSYYGNGSLCSDRAAVIEDNMQALML